MNFTQLMVSIAALGLLVGGTDGATETAPKYVMNRSGERPEPVVAVENVCAWPNLTRLPDGDIVALIYNQPSHGRMPGDVECWASSDEGETWEKRSVAAPRGTPTQNRMNVAAGLTAEGKLILIVSGWSAPGNPEARNKIGKVLPTWVCISQDGGRTWTIDKDSFPGAPDGRHLIPFGDIMPGADGKLRVAAYCGEADEDAIATEDDNPLVRRAVLGQNWVVRGDGRSWDKPVPICDMSRFNETALLHLGAGRWLAAARYRSGSVMILHSDDDVKTWSRRRRVTRGGFPGHLLRLSDGTVLLSYGNRTRARPGVDVRFSEDAGLTWSEPYQVLATSQRDHGYPSSVQLENGCVLTAYYALAVPELHTGYHMGTVVWDPRTTRTESD